MNEREKKAKEIISKIIKVPVDKLGNDDDLVDKHGMDSLARVEIVTELEKAFDILIEDAEAIKLRTVNLCLQLIDKQLAKK
jgi:acyl carrier protein